MKDMHGYKNEYVVDSDLKARVEAVLKRSFIDYMLSYDEDGRCVCFTDIPEHTYNKIVSRANCEKKSLEDGVFYFTQEESKDAYFCMCMKSMITDFAQLPISELE